MALTFSKLHAKETQVLLSSTLVKNYVFVKNYKLKMQEQYLNSLVGVKAKTKNLHFRPWFRHTVQKRLSPLTSKVSANLCIITSTTVQRWLKYSGKKRCDNKQITKDIPCDFHLQRHFWIHPCRFLAVCDDFQFRLLRHLHSRVHTHESRRARSRTERKINFG